MNPLGVLVHLVRSIPSAIVDDKDSRVPPWSGLNVDCYIWAESGGNPPFRFQLSFDGDVFVDVAFCVIRVLAPTAGQLL